MSRIAIIIPDNGGKYHWAPLGAGQLVGRLYNWFNDVRIIHMDMLHLDHDRVVGEVYDQQVDSVGIGWIAGRHTHDVCMPLCKDIKASTSSRLIIGGHAPSSDPEWYLEHTGADALIVGEADGLAKQWDDLEGIVPGESDSTWWPWNFNNAAMQYYSMVPAPGALATDRVAPVMSGFGCPYTCSFCYRLTEGHRPRPVEDIADEIAELRDRFRITYVQFQDELLMTSPGRVREVCDAIGHLGVRWSCQGRVNVAARAPDVLGTMQAAGCRFINYGVESASQKVLDLMDKRQTVEQSHIALEATRRAGISPGVNMLWGCPGDTEESLGAAVDMILRYSDGAQRRTIRPVTPYPGSPLFDFAVKEGKLSGTGDFWEQHKNSDLITVDFMDIPRKKAHQLLKSANWRLLTSYHDRSWIDLRMQARALYDYEDAGFRGWRQI
jgi:radical SAM superfamily enzyme YgiQ (UPF0313 family)